MEPPFPRTALSATAALLIWAANFLFIYVFTALACARGYAQATAIGFGIVPFASAVSTAVALVATAVLMIRGARAAHRAAATSSPAATTGIFLGRLAAIVAMLALIAVVIVGVPGFLIAQTCA